MTCRLRSVFVCFSISIGLCIGVCAQPRRPEAAPASDNASSALTSLGLATGDARAVVLYFIASDCPVSNRLLPEMLRIEREFAAHRVRFYFIYPNSTETPATIRAHRASYGLDPKNNTRTDPQNLLAKLTGANTTPEASVLIPQGKTLKPVYTGRIDDRYLSLGTERPVATRHDLEDAITAVLASHPALPPGGPPVGCAFMTLSPK